MLVDLTMEVTKISRERALDNESIVAFGHLGTHFDVMDKEFPIEFTKRNGVVFDVKDIEERDIEEEDIDIEMVEENMFVGFYSGFSEKVDYGTKEYYLKSPQLSQALIEKLLQKISIIGIDFAGVRRGIQHTPMDQFCANHGVFIIENLINLDKLVDPQKEYRINIYPIKFKGMTGLPCRVVAEI